MATSDSNQVTTVWRTKLARTFRIIFYVAKSVVDPKNAIIVGLIDLIEKITQAKCEQVALSVVHPESSTPASGDYNTVEDRVDLTLIASNGKAHNWKVPAPTVVFTADNETVDPTSTAVVAWVSAMSTYAVGQDGETTLGNVVSGHRDERKRVKK